MKTRIATALAVLVAGLGLGAAPAYAALANDKAVALYNTWIQCYNYTGCDTSRAYVVYDGGPAGCSAWAGYFPTRYYGWRSIHMRGVGGCR